MKRSPLRHPRFHPGCTACGIPRTRLYRGHPWFRIPRLRRRMESLGHWHYWYAHVTWEEQDVDLNAPP